jgi:hypothetical protein
MLSSGSSVVRAGRFPALDKGDSATEARPTKTLKFSRGRQKAGIALPSRRDGLTGVDSATEADATEAYRKQLKTRGLKAKLRDQGNFASLAAIFSNTESSKSPSVSNPSTVSKSTFPEGTSRTMTPW